MFNIVLLEPEIPQNTGNIARTCVATNTALHIIRPMGFTIGEKQVKRAGLDYWDKLNLHIYDDIDDFYLKNAGSKIYYCSTKASRTYCDFEYSAYDYFMFGKESKGIPEEILRDNYETAIRIPMQDGIRSLNLSNSVAIILYEAIRQEAFLGLSDSGIL